MVEEKKSTLELTVTSKFDRMENGIVLMNNLAKSKTWNQAFKQYQGSLVASFLMKALVRAASTWQICRDAQYLKLKEFHNPLPDLNYNIVHEFSSVST